MDRGPLFACSGSYRQPLLSLHFHPFLAANGSSRVPFIPPFMLFSGSLWHLTAAHSLPPLFSWHLALALGNPSPLPISAIFWKLAATNGSPSLPPIYANLWYLVVAHGSPSHPRISAISFSPHGNSQKPLPSPHLSYFLASRGN